MILLSNSSAYCLAPEMRCSDIYYPRLNLLSYSARVFPLNAQSGTLLCCSDRFTMIPQGGATAASLAMVVWLLVKRFVYHDRELQNNVAMILLLIVSLWPAGFFLTVTHGEVYTPTTS